MINDEVLNDFGEMCKMPLRNGILRCELIGNDDVEKNELINGELRFRIYNYRGNLGISVLLEKN